MKAKPNKSKENRQPENSPCHEKLQGIVLVPVPRGARCLPPGAKIYRGAFGEVLIDAPVPRSGKLESETHRYYYSEIDPLFGNSDGDVVRPRRYSFCPPAARAAGFRLPEVYGPEAENYKIRHLLKLLVTAGALAAEDVAAEIAWRRARQKENEREREISRVVRDFSAYGIKMTGAQRKALERYVADEKKKPSGLPF